MEKDFKLVSQLNPSDIICLKENNDVHNTTLLWMNNVLILSDQDVVSIVLVTFTDPCSDLDNHTDMELSGLGENAYKIVSAEC